MGAILMKKRYASFLTIRSNMFKLFVHKIESFIAGLHNLWVWFPIIWNDRNWDYAYLLDVMIKKLQLMDAEFEAFYHGNPRPRHIKTCMLLLKRINEDRYIFLPEYERLSVLDKKLKYKFHDNVVKRDKELFFKLFSRHFEGWWD